MTTAPAPSIEFSSATIVRSGHSRPSRAGGPAKTTSVWLAIPFLWLFIISTRSISSWLHSGGIDSSADPDLAGSPIDRALLTGLMVLGLFVLGSRWEKTRVLIRQNKWIVALFVYMGLSICWSNFPAISARRYVRSFGTLIMVLMILTETDALTAIRTLLRRLYLLHIPLSIAAIKYFRNIGVAYTWDGVEEMWVGLCVHKNNLGQVAMCSGIVSAWQVLARWPKKLTADLLLLGATVWLLRGSPNSHSSTAIGGFAFGVCLLVALQCVKGRVKRLRRFALAGVLAATVLIPVTIGVFGAFDTTPVDFALHSAGRDMTLTGRTGLWQDLLDNAQKNPLSGVGFGAFWVGHIGYEMYPLANWSSVTPGWRPNQGHDGYLDVYVDLGAIGLVLVLLVIGKGITGAVRELNTNFELGRIRLTLLLCIVLNNITESSLLKGTHSLWFILLLMAVNLPAARQRNFIRVRGAQR